MEQHKRALVVLALAQTACLACGLWVGDQFLLAALRQDPTAEIAASASVDKALSSLPVVRILTLVWITGLQGGVGYMVLTRLRNETSQNHTESQMRLLHREKDLVRTRNAVIFGLAQLADCRDRETGQHLERIALYSTCLGTALRGDRRFRESVSATFVTMIGISSVLHDIGKVALADAILRKEGRLSDDERQQMQKHTNIGAECIRDIEKRLGSCNFLSMAKDVAQFHHERWDGQGYPTGISGEQIPLSARVVAIADVYDALASKRVYKDAYPHEKCVELIAQSSGTQFDPNMVEVFLQVASQFQQIAARFGAADSPAPQANGPTLRAADQKLIKSLIEQADSAAPVVALP